MIRRFMRFVYRLIEDAKLLALAPRAMLRPGRLRKTLRAFWLSGLRDRQLAERLRYREARHDG